MESSDLMCLSADSRELELPFNLGTESRNKGYHFIFSSNVV